MEKDDVSEDRGGILTNSTPPKQQGVKAAAGQTAIPVVGQTIK